MDKPKIEEFMLFLDSNNRMGVIIKKKSCDDTCWKKCFKNSGGQVFRENSNDDSYTNIIELYKSKDAEEKVYYAFQFMTDSKHFNILNRYECVYSKIKT